MEQRRLEVALGEELGRGAHSSAHATTLEGREVVAKIALASSAEAELRLRREAAAMARIGHPSVVEVWEVGRCEDGRGYLIMDRVRGSTLAHVLRGGPRNESWVIELGRRLAEALEHVHARGLVHRDLKPSNILIPDDRSPQPKLIDFGLAVVAHEQQRREVAGTLAYSAPEQTGALHQPVDGRSDLYALGCILFECLVGRPPFEHDQPAELIRMHLQEVPPELSALRPGISPAVNALVTKLLAKDPDDRPSDAHAVARTLARLERGGETALRVHAPTPRAWVGRELLLHQIEARLMQALRGRGSAVHLTGPHGSGRSSLAREVAAVTTRHAANAWLLSARQAGGVPFDRWKRWLRALGALDRDGRLDVAAAALGNEPFLVAIVPELGHALGTRAAPAEAGQDRYYEAAARFRLSAISPAAGEGGGGWWAKTGDWRRSAGEGGAVYGAYALVPT